MRDDLDREFLTGLIEETPIGIRTREELILSLLPEVYFLDDEEDLTTDAG